MENYKTIKKIDIHSHAWPFAEYMPPVYNGERLISPEQLLAFYDKIGIEKSVLLPISAPEGLVTPTPSENAKYLSDKYPDRFLWFCNVDPRAWTNRETTNLYSLLEFYKSIGAKGVGEVTANLYADDPKVLNLFSACEALELPVTIHIAVRFVGYGLVDDIGLPRIEKILKTFPKLKLLGHSQAFWSEIDAKCTEDDRTDYPAGKVTDGRLAQLMRKYNNLYCDISAGSGANAFMRDPEYAVQFINEFADRILYGVDICIHNQTFPYDFDAFLKDLVERKQIEGETYCKIVRHNAEKLLGL